MTTAIDDLSFFRSMMKNPDGFDRRVSNLLTPVEKQSSVMTKHFNKKRRAHQQRKSPGGLKGNIDINRVHLHRITDDIFERKVVTPDGKNHGVYVLLDFSQSMRASISNMLDDAYTLVRFCEKAKIPFEFITFTQISSWHDTYKSKHEILRDGKIKLAYSANPRSKEPLTLRRIFSSSYSSEKNKAMYLLSRMAGCETDAPYNKQRLDSTDICRTDEIRYEALREKYVTLWGTPLYACLLHVYPLILKMKRKYNIEHMNLLVFTDGSDNANLETLNVSRIRDPLTSKVYKVDSFDATNGLYTRMPFMSQFYEILRDRGIGVTHIYHTNKKFLTSGNFDNEFSVSFRWSSIFDMYYFVNFKEMSFLERTACCKQLEGIHNIKISSTKTYVSFDNFVGANKFFFKFNHIGATKDNVEHMKDFDSHKLYKLALEKDQNLMSKAIVDQLCEQYVK